MKTKFAEVKIDYKEEETGNIAIDAFLKGDDSDDDGRVVAWVTPDGEVIKGTGELCEVDDLACDNVQDAIQKAKSKQADTKQDLVDEVAEDLKRVIEAGDYTTLDELLKFVPTTNLIQALPEEVWEKFSPQIKK